jgi:DNA polymerase elongation subunit (family B)
MKILAKHKSLANLVDYRGWGFVKTNEFEEIKKQHLLEMRKDYKPFVFQTAPARDSRDGTVKNASLFNKYYGNIYGPDWNSAFYGITFEGLMFVRANFPELKSQTDRMLVTLFNEVFNEGFSVSEWKKRGYEE